MKKTVDLHHTELNEEKLITISTTFPGRTVPCPRKDWLFISTFTDLNIRQQPGKNQELLVLRLIPG